MSARYQLRKVGVFDLERGELVTPMHGEGWAAYHAWLKVDGNAPDPEPPPPLPSLEEAIARKLAEAEAMAAAQRERITGAVSAQEMASWSQKLAQARAFKERVTALGGSVIGADDVAPMLAIEAQARGVTTRNIADRVLANADAYSQAEAFIAGVCGRHKDAIRALVDVEAVLSYNVRAGWFPEPEAPPPTL